MNAMDGKVCLVTGATSGIGKVTAEVLASMGAQVIIHGRDRAKVQEVIAGIERSTGNQGVTPLIADLSRLRDVREAAAAVNKDFDRLDVLLNNAGGIFSPRVVTEDGMERTFQIDYLSHYLLTRLLLDRLKAAAPSRVINVSSSAHLQGTIHFDDLQLARRFSPFRAYSQAKLAQVMFTYELSRRLEGTGITVNALHPGWVSTNFGASAGLLIKYGAKFSYLFGRRPRVGAETSIYLATSPKVEKVTGRYFINEKEASSSKESYDREEQRRLWEVSEKLAEK